MIDPNEYEVYWEKMDRVERLIVHMHLQEYSPTEVHSCLGRLGLRYKGLILKEVYQVSVVTQNLLKEFTRVPNQRESRQDQSGGGAVRCDTGSAAQVPPDPVRIQR
jgi:hypothetical protein